MNFVIYHVLKSLIICWTEKYLCIHLPSSVSVVHYLITSKMIVVFAQQFGNFLDVNSIVEWGSITNFPFVGTEFSLKFQNNLVIKKCFYVISSFKYLNDILANFFCIPEGIQLNDQLSFAKE